MSAAPVQLQAHSLACVRGDRPLFADVSFVLTAGQWLYVEGDNGVGKTSLLRMLCGLSPAAQGHVSWCGHAIADQPATYRAALLYLGHALALKDELSPLENLQVDAAIAGRSWDAVQAQQALHAQGLRGREHLPLRVLSQGQKRRTALARLQASTAALWILDEPFVALDAASVQALRQVLCDHVGRGGMVVFTSHQAVTLDGQGMTYRLGT